MLATADGAVAPIETPEIVTAYLGSFIEVGRGHRSGKDVEHAWEVRGHVFRTVNDRPEVYKPCARCGGWGQFSYNQIDGTVCYGCYGTGLGAQISGWDEADRLVKQREARARAAERKLMRELHVEALAWDAWYAAAPGRQGMIAALLAQPRDEYSNEYGTDFLGKMATLVRGCIPLTERQEAAVMRTLGQRAERIEAKQAAGHWGVVGKRAEVDVTVRSVKHYDGDYGTRYLVVMETAEGQTLKTWASGEFGWEAFRWFQADGAFAARVKATVKQHTEYQGAPQTELSRVALVA